MISNSSLYQSVHEKFFGKNLKDVMSFEIESKALSLLAEMIDNAENTDGYARTLILVGLYAILISFIGEFFFIFEKCFIFLTCRRFYN